MMKLHFKIALLLLAGLFLFSSCEKLDQEFTQFTVEYTSKLTVDNGIGLNLPLNILTPEMETNAEAEFAVHDTRKDLVEEVILEEMSLKVTSPSNQRLDFMNSIKVYINAEGLSEVEIAFKDPVPSDVGDELQLDVNSNNLRDFIIKDKFSLRIEVVSDQITGQDVDIDVFSKFFVDAKLI